MIEQTLILIKPDAVERSLAEPIAERIRQVGLNITKQKEMSLSVEMATEHYQEHVGKAFFPTLLAYITSGPIVAMVVEGEKAISRMRALIGPTNPLEAPPGTLRGDLRDPHVPPAQQKTINLIHGSDSATSAAREIALFFPQPT